MTNRLPSPAPAARWYARPAARAFSAEPAPAEVFAFHQRLNGYGPTALKEVPDLAAELEVGRVFVKEESLRLGLPAFKIMGASWAVCRALAEHAGQHKPPTSLKEMSPYLAGVGELTLVAATDGNHGRAVAHVARLLGLAAEIFVPAAISERVRNAIVSEGANVVELRASYDDVVRAAAARVALAEDGEALLIQDTAFNGYEELPGWVVEGYSTIFREIDLQLAELGVADLDALAVPVGVGSLAQAAVRHYRIGRCRPSLLSVEPTGAGCLLESLHAGRRISVTTGATLMAGLNCGTVSLTAWPDLRSGVDAAVLVTDNECRQAVHDLETLGIDSGPCGGASLAGMRAALAWPTGRNDMGVAAGSVIVLLSTEGRAATPMD